jgi:hypothetical protein
MPTFLPDFNLTCNMWRPPAIVTDPPTDIFNCQLYVAPKGFLDITPSQPTLWVPPIWLRLPPLTDLRPGDEVECPAGSGRTYVTRWVEDLHKGFPNEYRVGLLEQDVQPFPLP